MKINETNITPEAPIRQKTPAVFLDCDGTIIEDRGDLREPNQAIFFPHAIEFLRRLQKHFLLFIVTHQQGVGKGTPTCSGVERANAFVMHHLRPAGVRIERTYCYPHRRDEHCQCSKPSSFFLYRAVEEFALDLSHSFVVGNHPCDFALAENAGAQGICVRIGHGASYCRKLPDNALVAPSIREAVEWILCCHALWKLEEKVPDAVARAAEILRSGGVGAFPTETVYGLGASLRSQPAIARIFEIKARPRFDPLIVHVEGETQLQEVTAQVPEKAQKLTTCFWPGPLTLVLPKSAFVPDLVTAGLDTVAVRMPRHPLALSLIRSLRSPIAAPSANRFGRISPTTAEHVRTEIGGQIDFLLDGGPCPVGVESTIVSLVGKEPLLLRPGGIPVEEIEAVIGPLQRLCADNRSVWAPGMLPRHYAPQTPLQLVRDLSAAVLQPGLHVGILAFRSPPLLPSKIPVEVLSTTGDLREAASNLFSALRRLDERKLDLILAEEVPEIGLGLAINDRLRRASRSFEE